MTPLGRLFKFSVRCFTVPKRDGKQRSLATQVNRQAKVEESRSLRDPFKNLAILVER